MGHNALSFLTIFVRIDFGFMISTAPGGGILESSPFKLTSDMIKIMGTDEKSPLYTVFKELCVKAFLAARIYAFEIINVTYVMRTSGLPCFKGRDSIRNLKERFALDKTDQQAAEIMLNCIKVSHANTRRYVPYHLFRIYSGARR